MCCIVVSFSELSIRHTSSSPRQGFCGLGKDKSCSGIDLEGELNIVGYHSTALILYAKHTNYIRLMGRQGSHPKLLG